VPKEKLAMLAIPMMPLQIILPWIISRYTAGPRPNVCFGRWTVPHVLLCYGVVHLRASSGLKFRPKFQSFLFKISRYFSQLFQSNIQAFLYKSPNFFPDFLVLHVRQYHGLLRTSVWPGRRRHLHDPSQHVDQSRRKLAINPGFVVKHNLSHLFYIFNFHCCAFFTVNLLQVSGLSDVQTVWPVIKGRRIQRDHLSRQRVLRRDGNWRVRKGRWKMRDRGWRVLHGISFLLPIRIFMARTLGLENDPTTSVCRWKWLEGRQKTIEWKFVKEKWGQGEAFVITCNYVLQDLKLCAQINFISLYNIALF